MDDTGSAIVVDCGAYCCRVGFGGEDAPTSVVRTPNAFNAIGLNRGVFSHSNMQMCEYLWEYLLREELRVASRDYSVLLTEPACRPRQDRESWSEIWFEHFSVPALHVVSQPLLALYASGKTSGVVLYSGHQYTDILPVCEGSVLATREQRLAIGGHTITEYLGSLIRRHRGPIRLVSDHVCKMKKDICYVAKDYQKESECLTKSKLETYEFPDGREVSIGFERFKAPELLFKPVITGKDGLSLAELISSSIKTVDIESKRLLYSNVVVAGGNTSFPGFDERLLFELKDHIPSMTKLRLNSESNRGLSAWIGGSLMTSLGPSWQHFWITRDMYEEIGPSVVHRKSF